jgi:isopenicillin N synthase-like dioxygenase
MLAKRFNEAFEYRNGELYWKIMTNPSKKLIGKQAGCKSSGAYGVVNLDGKNYSIHKVIFCMHKGYIPEVVDHINGIKKDHRIENLRAATHQSNNWNKVTQTNNKLGKKNICWNKQNQKYWVQLTKNGNKIVSLFVEDLELAELVAIEARCKYHGEFANHGAR